MMISNLIDRISKFRGNYTVQRFYLGKEIEVQFENEYIALPIVKTSNKKGGYGLERGKTWAILVNIKKNFDHLENFILLKNELKKIGSDLKITTDRSGDRTHGIRIKSMSDNPDNKVISEILSFVFEKQSPNSEELRIPPVFFANLTCMENYHGPEQYKKLGAAYVRENNDAGEKNNFKKIDGKFFGFVHCSKNDKININTIAEGYGAIIKENNGNRYIENATVVFFSKPKNGLSKIVGYYKNATIYEKLLMNNQTGQMYCFSCDANDGALIPENDRTFSIPKKKDNTTYYGQDHRFYAKKDELIPFVQSVLKYIKDYEGKSQSKDDILSKAVYDSDIKVEFNEYKIKSELPTNNNYEHDYTPRPTSGTSKDSPKSIISGRKAEKYFIDFLKKKGFKSGSDFFDVANDKNYGYDVHFKNLGVEIKNIQNGSFYLSDNEIGHLKAAKTCLVLVDIDNGIWLLKNDSIWLNRVIEEIELIREHCKNSCSSIVLTDIRINITENAKSDICEITHFNYARLQALMLCNDEE